MNTIIFNQSVRLKEWFFQENNLAKRIQQIYMYIYQIYLSSCRFSVNVVEGGYYKQVTRSPFLRITDLIKPNPFCYQHEEKSTWRKEEIQGETQSHKIPDRGRKWRTRKHETWTHALRRGFHTQRATSTKGATTCACVCRGRERKRELGWEEKTIC